jgi:hypothetical protein
MPTYDVTWTEQITQTARFDLDDSLPPDHTGYTGDPEIDARDDNWLVARMGQAILDAILDHDGDSLEYAVEERQVTNVREVPSEATLEAARAQQAAMEAAALDIHVNDQPDDPEPGVVIGHCAGHSRPLTATETRHLAQLLTEQADHLDAHLPVTTAAGTPREGRGA